MERSGATVVFTKTKIALAAVLIAGASSAAMAQKIDTIQGPSDVGAAAELPLTFVAYHRSAGHAQVRHSRNARLDTYAPAQDLPPVSVVGPDNYKYWTQACCF